MLKVPIDKILQGDVREQLKMLPDNSVDCVITSPPYWGLRDYGVAGQLGLEATPTDYVDCLVSVFREVRRVMRPEATLWLNLGDSYAGSGRGRNSDGAHSHKASDKQASNRGSIDGRLLRPAAVRNHGLHTNAINNDAIVTHWVPPPPGLKPKDLVGIPWRVAFALQGDGWWLRQDIIWAKPNPMPESVTDRCTKAHEYLFLLSKSETYYFDAAAIREPATCGNHFRNITEPLKYARVPAPRQRGHKGLWKTAGVEAGRNRRSVWTINTQPYAEAHFATFPDALVAPCVMAGTKEGDLVLDPFMGSGTTAIVAVRARRHFVGIELNPKYVEMAERRLAPELAQGRIL